ncbi:MAG: Uma2 family endonuclease [Caldilineaceae bacterium]|jgi:Uma2 family endonuclease
MTLQFTAPSDTPAEVGDNGWPAQGQWRYTDYLHLPDDGRRYEIIEGVLYVANAPGFDHQFAVGETFAYLRQFIREHQLGVVLTAPFEVHLSETSKPVQPDVFFIRKERQPTAGDRIFVGAPDLIVEVISPSSIRLDRKAKFDAYERYGVAEYWLVEPKLRGVEVYILSNGEYALLGQYTGNELIESQMLAGLQIKANDLFPPAP